MSGDPPMDPEEFAEQTRLEETARWSHAVGRARDNDEVADWEKKHRVPTRPGFAGFRKVMRRLK